MRICPVCKAKKSERSFYKTTKIRACKACHRIKVENSDKARREPSFTGDPDGKGEQHYPDGGQFIGHFKRGKRHGPGTYTFADGRQESGTWINGQIEITREDVKQYANS